MNENNANELRLVANEIMRKLYYAGQREQLFILFSYASRAIEEIDKERAALAAKEDDGGKD